MPALSLAVPIPTFPRIYGEVPVEAPLSLRIAPVRATAPPKCPSAKLRVPKARAGELCAWFTDRLQHVFDRGGVKLVERRVDVADADGPAIDLATLAVLLREALPEEHAEGWLRPDTPSTYAPGSPNKVAELARRYAEGVGLWHDKDADAVRDDRLGVRGRLRRNTPKVKGGGSLVAGDLLVEGWVDEDED